MNNKILISLLLLALSINLEAQKSLSQILFDDYIGFNDNIGVQADIIKVQPYKKLYKKDLKSAGFTKKQRKKMIAELKETISYSEYHDNLRKISKHKDTDGTTIKTEYKYDEGERLIETRIINIKDTIKYIFDYDSLNRPVRTTQLIANKRLITETADFSKEGEVKLTHYFSKEKIAEEEIYPYKIGFKKHVKSIEINRKKNEITITGVIVNRDNSEYISKYKLDQNNNWISRKLYIRINGKKYKVSKSTRNLQYVK